jgi:hypothetical protein
VQRPSEMPEARPLPEDTDESEPPVDVDDLNMER